jgi:hypothetical protein
MAKSRTESVAQGLTRIAVTGFKSIGDRQSIELAPLTILAGANSSGKSSMMQAPLLLKQTLEAPYDPGPLLLRGPNVAFSSADQLFHKRGGRGSSNLIEFELSVDGGRTISLGFSKSHQASAGPIALNYQRSTSLVDSFVIKPGEEETLREHFIKSGSLSIPRDDLIDDYRLKISREKSFFHMSLIVNSSRTIEITRNIFDLSDSIIIHIDSIIHLSGLRGSPERTYPVTAIGRSFPGTFERYTASVIAGWFNQEDDCLQLLGDQLAQLGLTWKVEPRSIDDTQVELRVGRLPASRNSGSRDLVSIADVGLGVSQTLPVLVSLLVARPGQLVYIEQPEIHLHPKAQFALARVLVDAANRGVRAVIETHSSLLLLGVQEAVARGDLTPDKVKLHWFNRDPKTGATTIRTADLDEAGRFGDWPEDFSDVTLDAEGRYLDAAQERLARGL